MTIPIIDISTKPYCKDTSPWMEFHVSRKTRDRYHLDETLFSTNGNVILADFHAARIFAHHLNEKRDLLNFPEDAVKASHINAMGLIDEMTHFLFRMYREEVNPNAMKQAVQWLYVQFKRDEINRLFLQFIDEFPPLAVYKGEIKPVDYLEGKTENVSHRELLLEELLILWLQNVNPAFDPFKELFNDDHLESRTVYNQSLEALQRFFEDQPSPQTGHRSLIEMLLEPARQFPHSLVDQLDMIRRSVIRAPRIWQETRHIETEKREERRKEVDVYIQQNYVHRPLTAIDFIKEEADRQPFQGAKAATEVPSFSGQEAEPEQYSQDQDWMPTVVMIAKNSFVWLDQLSKKNNKEIRKLDQIPDEELDRLQSYGITALWLIGLWERSRASRKIKQLCGNPEAVASAYSLFDYKIATDLGGQKSFDKLKQRALKRGIRLAGDMVPNHMGIDSNWVVEHPEWFVSVAEPPFFVYEYKGPNLSPHHDVAIFIEDHYYSRKDAAVVFKHVDHRTNKTRYIYHGNDGTNMPWNDTAQLNYLLPEVREAAIKAILKVAEMTPIIRFDAAMTLAKKHYQRLWYPQPGTGGDIPSRAEFALTKAEFDEHMPTEFWREVVERVASEKPDTLLLAEAFWLMEGYFVRTLGMHRVYNSAFMNMLRNEENAKFRETIHNILAFDPQILQRHVNFMNNPDEDTAVSQFGKGDKYFGICAMMVTMPGLPMFGHGQIEGYTEKYGMEYRRAYYDEKPDEYLIARHEREIFPLLKKRRIFTDAEHFHLYDVVSLTGVVNEDVFAYSNEIGSEKGLVAYHNKFAIARGWVRVSAPYLAKSEEDEEERLFVQKSLGESLNLTPDPSYFCIMRDQMSGLEYIHPSDEVTTKGLYIELGAYKCQVFTDIREVRDTADQSYAELCAYLNRRGVPSITDAINEIVLRPIQPPFRDLINAERFLQLMTFVESSPTKLEKTAFLDDFEKRYLVLLESMKAFLKKPGDEKIVAQSVRQKLDALMDLPQLATRCKFRRSGPYQSLCRLIRRRLRQNRVAWATLLSWTVVHELGKMETASRDFDLLSRSWIDEWALGKTIEAALHDFDLTAAEVDQSIRLIKAMTSAQLCLDKMKGLEDKQSMAVSARAILTHLFKENEVQRYFEVNRFQDKLWFKGEPFQRVLDSLFMLSYLKCALQPELKGMKCAQALLKYFELTRKIDMAKRQSDFMVEKLLGYFSKRAKVKTKNKKTDSALAPLSSLKERPKTQTVKKTKAQLTEISASAKNTQSVDPPSLSEEMTDLTRTRSAKLNEGAKTIVDDITSEMPSKKRARPPKK